MIPHRWAKIEAANEKDAATLKRWIIELELSEKWMEKRSAINWTLGIYFRS